MIATQGGPGVSWPGPTTTTTVLGPEARLSQVNTVIKKSDEEKILVKNF